MNERAQREARKKHVLSVTDALEEGEWATYTTVSLIVYGHENGRQAVGSILRREGDMKTAHRVLAARGEVAKDWEGVGGGREQCIDRLQREGTWDRDLGRARAERVVNHDTLRKRGV